MKWARLRSRSNIQRMPWNPSAPAGPTISPSTSTWTWTINRISRTISANARVEMEKYRPLSRRVRAPTTIAITPATHAPARIPNQMGRRNMAVTAPAA